MTRFRFRATRFSSRAFPAWRFWSAWASALALAGCVSSSGQPVGGIGESGIAGAYIPLHVRTHLGLDSDEAAAIRIAPGVAATDAHNANLLDPKSVIGQVRDYDLMFFRSPGAAAPRGPAPRPGDPVIAYGQGADAELRVAHGVVRQIQACDGCGPAPAWFTFAGDAGPGFSGGPVVDTQGRLVGVTFGYRDTPRERLIYAYDMARVDAELQRFQPH